MTSAEPVALVWPTTSRALVGLDGAFGDLLHPHGVFHARLAIGGELRGVGLEQEFHRQAIGLDAVADDALESLACRLASVELPVGQVEAVEHAELLAARRAQGALVVIQRIEVLLGVVGLDRIIDEG